jgi:hypothetical protein
MATSNKSKYSTYAGLDTAPPVNWGSVANTISRQIGLFNEKRKADQQAVEDATQSAIEKLNELPDVNSQDLDTALLESAKSQQEQLMMNMGLVRKGVIKMHDYKMRMNSMKNGYTNFKNITKVYDGWYTAAKDRVKNKTATEADIAFMERIESFGNLKDKKFMTNPANGQLQVVTMGYNEKTKKYDIMPDPRKEPNSFQNPGVILDMMKYDGGIKVDLDAATSEVTDKLGVIIRSSINPDTGEKYSMEDFRQIFKSPERLKAMGISGNVTTFDQWLDSQADALTGDDAAMAQILATQAGYQYKDPTAANYIELKGTGNSVVFGKDGKGLSETDRKKARDIVKNMISQKIDSKQDAQRGFSPDVKNKRDDKIKKGGTIIENLDAVYSGDQAQVDGALDALYASSGFRYDSFSDEGDYFDVVYFDKNGDRKQQRLSKGKNKEDFLNTGYAFFQTDDSGADYKDARGMANISGRNQSDFAMNEVGKRMKFKMNEDGEFVDKDDKPTTRRSQMVEANRTPEVDGKWDGTYVGDDYQKDKGEYKINKKRSTPSQQKREAREAININTPIGDGKQTLNSVYKGSVDDIVDNVINTTEGEVSKLASDMSEAINIAANERNDASAAQRVNITSNSDDSITVEVDGKEIATVPITKDNKLTQAVNKAIDKALNQILPAQAGGYGDGGGKYD